MSDYAETDESKANFVLLQARYRLQLKNKLAAGEISQEYFDNNIWLATQQLENAWPGISGEFFQAVDNGDYLWLARKINKSYDYVKAYLLDVINKGTTAAENLGFAGWTAVLLVLGAVGLLLYVKVK